MAKLLFGAIVTKAVGKLGGHCFRIKGNVQILQRNPYCNNYNVVVKNPAIAPIQKAFKGWSSLTPGQQNIWKENALTIPKKDRFGNNRTFSGRDLYTSCTINNLVSGQPEPDVNKFDNKIPDPTTKRIVMLRYDEVSGAVNLIDQTYQSNGYLTIGAKRVYSSSNNFKPEAIKKVISFFNDEDRAQLIYASILNSGIEIFEGDHFNISIFTTTTSGIKSVTQVFNVQVVQE